MLDKIKTVVVENKAKVIRVGAAVAGAVVGAVVASLVANAREEQMLDEYVNNQPED